MFQTTLMHFPVTYGNLYSVEWTQWVILVTYFGKKKTYGLWKDILSMQTIQAQLMDVTVIKHYYVL